MHSTFAHLQIAHVCTNGEILLYLRPFVSEFAWRRGTMRIEKGKCHRQNWKYKIDGLLKDCILIRGNSVVCEQGYNDRLS